jgi:hypothetical protein
MYYTSKFPDIQHDKEAYLEAVDRLCDCEEPTITKPQSQLRVLDCDTEGKPTTGVLAHDDVVKAPDYLVQCVRSRAELISRRRRDL